MNSKYKFVPAGRYGDKERSCVTCYELELVIRFIEQHAMIHGEVDGEDSAGRAKARRSTPQEVVAYAFSLATEVVAEAERRGWIEPPVPFDPSKYV